MPVDPEELVPTQLRAARALLGWSQQDLARHARVAVSTVADFERGQRVPVPNNLEAMRVSLQGAGITFLPGGAVVGPRPAVASAWDSGEAFRWIDATDLSHWADRRDGQAMMPELLARLIRAERGTSARVDFPSGDSVKKRGWDGVCFVAEGDQHIPAGWSGWEITAQRDGTKAKADGDYNKRLKNPAGLDRASTTFIFVTARQWSKKREWEQARRKEGTWADVRAYDADDLVQWIELFPAVGHWLAVQVGKRPAGLRQLDEAWREWSLSTNPPMSIDVLLGGRDEESARLLRWLNSDPSALAVQADSEGEAVAFLYGAMEQLPPEYRVAYQRRCLVAATTEAARTIADASSPLILVIGDADAGFAAHLTKRGHHVYLVHGSDIGVPDEVLRLPRPKGDIFALGLKAMGIKEEDVATLARDSAHSLSVLRRLIPSNAAVMNPRWAQPENARKLVAAVLAGAWDEGQPADREALARLSGESYETISARLAGWVGCPDSPLRKAGSVWRVASPRDAWFLLAPHLTATHLERFTDVATGVLTSADPRFQMKPDERWLAPLHGQKPKHSEPLRTGLCETLILLSVFGRQIHCVPDAPARAGEIARRLLQGADAQQWWSLSPHLEVLAEASPGVFLGALEEDLASTNPAVIALFEEDTGLTVGMHHAELLWALETLAWSGSYLARVARLLAKLARLAPKGRSANRPESSLHGIFRLWRPQTSATFQQRLRVLEGLRPDEPDVAWRLMLGLLPRDQDWAVDSHRPRWRDFALGPRETPTYGEIWQAANAISAWLLADVGLVTERWRHLMKHLPQLPPDKRREVLDQLLAVVPQVTLDEDRVQLRDTLRQLLRDHRACPDAGWVMPEAELADIEEAYKALEPTDTVSRVAWLFSGTDAIVSGSPGCDWQAEEEAADNLRREAIEGLLAGGDPRRVFELARKAQWPGLVGKAVIQARVDAAEKESILTSALSKEDAASEGLAYGIIVVASQGPDGASWVEALLDRAARERWPAKAIAWILLSLPESQDVWDRATAMGQEVEDIYWRRTGARRIRENAEEIGFATRKLMGVGRARGAVHLAGPNAKKLPSELMVELLHQAAGEPCSETGDANEATMFQYSVEELLLGLDQKNDVRQEQIARLEWTYLPILRYSRRPPTTLHKALSADPAFFVEVVSAIYRRRGEACDGKNADADTEQVRAVASHAFELLESWSLVPGTQDRAVDATSLKEWVKEARKLCMEAGREAVGNQQIGRVLAYAPQGDDGVWPAAAVRDVIETSCSRDLENGVMMGVHSKRGVTSRAILDGGAQERQAAETYRKWAQATRFDWPRTSALLERIAVTWEQEGQWHDEDAERTDWSL